MKQILNRIFLFTITMFLGIAVTAKENRTILICIDGCNASVVDYAYSPNIHALMDNATYSTKVELRNNGIPTSGWATLLTGAYATNHKVLKDGTWEGNNFANFPLLFDRIKTVTPDKKTMAIVSNPLLYEIVLSADYHQLVSNDDATESSIVTQLKSDNKTSLFFIEFNDVFNAGKARGFDNAIIEYVSAFSKVDERVGNIMGAIKQRANYTNENWTIIITSNHGGKYDGTYGGGSKSEITVPIIVSGDNIDKRDMASGLSDARADKNNSIQINPEKTSDYRYVMIKKTGTKLQNMKDFTVEFKVYASPWTSDPSIMGDKDWNSGGNPGWTIFRNGNSYGFNLASTKRVRIDMKNVGVIEDGDWHHVAVSFDPTGYCRLYTDGVMTIEKQMAYTKDDEFSSPFDYLAIGNEGTLKYANWKGIIDEVRIWDVALPSETINAYAKKDNIEKSDHPNLNSLLAYYKMDETSETSGNQVVDYSPNKYHGSLVKCNRVLVSPLKLTDLYPTLIDNMGGTVLPVWLLNGDIIKNDVRFILGEVGKTALSSVGSHYPNPIDVSQALNVIIPEELKDADKAELKVIGLNGFVYKQEQVSLKYQETYKITDLNMKPGFYIYSFRSGDRYLLGKFQIK